MSKTFKRLPNFGSEVQFVNTAGLDIQRSRMDTHPVTLTTFNAGEIVPVFYKEILPYSTFSVDVDFVIRQNTLTTPTMGTMTADLYAFFVPNRVVNHSWKTVFGENPNGSWTIKPISLAPLVDGISLPSGVSINVGSVADYYGFATQAPIPITTLRACNDLKFRGYVEIYNEYFRDQNYQPPIPYSKLNVYENFFHIGSSSFGLGGSSNILVTPVASDAPNDNSYGSGAVNQAVYGNLTGAAAPVYLPNVSLESPFNANGSLLIANKLHDYFTSVLPSPQKSSVQVIVPLQSSYNSGDRIPVTNYNDDIPSELQTLAGMRFRFADGALGGSKFAVFSQSPSEASRADLGAQFESSPGGSLRKEFSVTNLWASIKNLGIDLSDIRMSAAIQQVYEQLARGGSRYREYIRSFFGLEVDDPFCDIPSYLGHIRRELDLYQVAQTSSSEAGSTAQGNLSAFGYTSSGGHLVRETFYEHGYLHVFCVVRHRNVYSSYLSRDNFRMTMLDYYQPQLNNISEQPVYTREINPFSSSSNAVFGYQEAWAEYRFDPDYVTGLMRPGVSNSLAIWNYADDFNTSLVSASGEWIKSNSKQVLDRTLAVTSSLSHQFKGQFKFNISKELPMSTYSVPGMDII